jgi:hypothetical protein
VEEPEVSQGVIPIAKTQNFTREGAIGQSGDDPGQTWRSLDAGLKQAGKQRPTAVASKG